MNQKTLQIVGAAAFVVVVGTVAFFIAGSFAGGEVSSQQVEESADWAEDLRDRLEPTIQADRALLPARGSFGDFVLVGTESGDARLEPPCTVAGHDPIDDRERIVASEFYSDAFGDSAEAFECTDGTIYGMSGYIQHELDRTEFGHGYYVGEAIVRLDAPEERLELTTIAGRPALIEHDLDLSPFPGQTRIYVIERTPDADQPGIMLTVYTSTTIDEGVRLAEELMR